MVDTKVVVVITVRDGAKLVVSDVLNPSQVLSSCFEVEVEVAALDPPGFRVEGLTMLAVVGVTNAVDSTGMTRKVSSGFMEPELTELAELTSVPL